MKPLRIFCAVEWEPFPGSRLWYNNIVEALKDLGHEVLLFDFDIDPFYHHADFHLEKNREWIEINRPKLQEALLGQIRSLHSQKSIDLLLTYFYSAHCDSETILKIREWGIKTFNWYCNASYQFDLVAPLAPSFDYSLVPEAFRLEDYKAIGAHPIYCQEAANPKFYKNLTLNRGLDVVFIGQNYADRLKNCVSLLEADVRIDVWGHHWKIKGDPIPKAILKKIMGREINRALPDICVHPPCDDAEMVSIYNRAKIALGFGVVASQEFQTKPIFQIRLRDFEAPMCGAFYLTQHQDELMEFFKIKEEIETFRDKAELVDKAKYYLKNESARRRIAKAGHLRALKEHTWQKRLSDIFQKTMDR